MDKNKITTSFYDAGGAQSFFKGTSFRAQKWELDHYYFCNSQYVDWVTYNGCILLCTRTHVSSKDNAPELILDSNGTPIGIEKNPCWEFALGGNKVEISDTNLDLTKLKIVDNQLFISNDGGETFVLVGTVGEVNPKQESIKLKIVNNTLFLSRDGGTVWEIVGEVGSNSFSDLNAEVVEVVEGEANASVSVENDTLAFRFSIPRGRDGVNTSGASVDYIYKLTETNQFPGNPTPTTWEGATYQSDNYCPTGWKTYPQQVSEIYDYQWVAVRKKTNNKWDRYSDPVIFNNYNTDGGVSPNAQFTSFAFCRTTKTWKTSDGRPTGGTWDKPIPSPSRIGGDTVTWTDTVPSGEGRIWMTTRTFTNNDTSTLWSQPQPLSDTSDFQVEFSASTTKPSIKNLNTYYLKDPVNYMNEFHEKNPDWSDNPSNPVWMATATLHNGIWSDWTVVKIKGEDGNDGKPINVVGTVETEEGLPNCAEYNGNAGDAYLVVTYGNESNVLFIYTGDDENCWIYAGSISAQGSYIHIKYATMPYEGNEDLKSEDLYGGSKYWAGFTRVGNETPGETPGDYIGIYWDTIEDDSMDPSKYTWNKWKGEDGWFYEYIYILTLTNEAPSVPNPSDYYQNNVVPDEWSDDPLEVTEENRYCWMVYRHKENNKWSDWIGSTSNPGKAALWNYYAQDGIQGVDGDSVEFIFCNQTVNGEPEKPTNDDWDYDDPEEPWYDKPQGVSKDNPIEWVSMRTKHGNDEWGKWSAPSKFSVFGEKGTDGEGYEYVFRLDNTDPYSTGTFTIPTDISDITTLDANQNPDYVPNPWKDDILQVTSDMQYLWCSTRRCINGTWTKFSKPVLWNKYVNDGKSWITLKLWKRFSSSQEGHGITGNITYDFSNGEYSGDTNGWSKSAPGSDQSKRYLYSINYSALVDPVGTINIPSGKWTLVLESVDGVDGSGQSATTITVDPDSILVNVDENNNILFKDSEWTVQANYYYGVDLLKSEMTITSSSNNFSLPSDPTIAEEHQFTLKINNGVTSFNTDEQITVTLTPTETITVNDAPITLPVLTKSITASPFRSNDVYKIWLNSDQIIVDPAKSSGHTIEAKVMKNGKVCTDSNVQLTLSNNVDGDIYGGTKSKWNDVNGTYTYTYNHDHSDGIKFFTVNLLLNNNPILTEQISVLCNGSTPYHLEFSNDMDQVYTVDGVVTTKQVVTTTIQLMADEGVEINTCEFVNPPYGAPNVTPIDATSKELSLTFEPSSTEITGTRLYYPIKVTTNTGATLSKKWPINVFDGTVDYDLKVTPTIVKTSINASGNIEHSPNEVSVKITKRDLAVNAKTITEVKQVPEGYTLWYNFQNDATETPIENFNGEHIITLGNKSFDVLVITLRKDNDIQDQVFVESIQDGVSPYHLELSNNMDQFWVDSQGNCVLNKTVTTKATLYYKGKVVNNNDVSFECKYAEASMDSNNITIAFTPGTHVEGNKYYYDVDAFVGGNPVATASFIITVLQGNADYDLVVDKTILKYSEEDQYLDIKVKSRELTGSINLFNFYYLHNLPDKIYAKINGNPVTDTTLINYTKYKIEAKSLDPIQIELWYSDGINEDSLIDSVSVEILKDGVNGFFTTIVKLWQRSVDLIDESKVTKPNGDITYNFGTNQFDIQGVNMNGWSTTPPTKGPNQRYLYSLGAYVNVQSSEVTIEPDDWNILTLESADGVDGTGQSATTATLVPDKILVNVDDNGYTRYPISQDVTANYYYGTSRIDTAIAKPPTNNPWIEDDDTPDNTFKVVIDEGTKITTTTNIDIEVVPGGEEGYNTIPITLYVTPIKSADRYSIVVDKNVVIYDPNIDYSQTNIDTITAQIYKNGVAIEPTDTCKLLLNVGGENVSWTAAKTKYTHEVAFSENSHIITITLELDGKAVTHEEVNVLGVSQSHYHLELNNEMDQIWVDPNGHPYESDTLDAEPQLYYGETPISGLEYSNAIVEVKTSDTLTEHITKKVTVTYNKITYTKTFKVLVLKGTVDYDLVVNPTHISNPDKDGEITVQVLKHDLITGIRENISFNANSDPKVKCRIDNKKDYTWLDSKGQTTCSIGYTLSHKLIAIDLIYLYDGKEVVIDSVTVDIMNDGASPVSVVEYYAYYGDNRTMQSGYYPDEEDIVKDDKKDWLSNVTLPKGAEENGLTWYKDTPQGFTSKTPYLWNVEFITLSNGDYYCTPPACISSSQNPIEKITEYYCIHDDATIAQPILGDDGVLDTTTYDWKTTAEIPTADKRYLFNCEVIKYKYPIEGNNYYEVTAPVCIGVYSKGIDGKSVLTTWEYYCITNGSTPPTLPINDQYVKDVNKWRNSRIDENIPTLDNWTYNDVNWETNEGSYLWNIEVTVYSDKDDGEHFTGDPNADGISVSTVILLSNRAHEIKSIEEYYAIANDSFEVILPGKDDNIDDYGENKWKLINPGDSAPVPNETHPYLYNVEKITYRDGTIEWGAIQRLGVYIKGEKGEDASKLDVEMSNEIETILVDYGDIIRDQNPITNTITFVDGDRTKPEIKGYKISWDSTGILSVTSDELSITNGIPAEINSTTLPTSFTLKITPTAGQKLSAKTYVDVTLTNSEGKSAYRRMHLIPIKDRTKYSLLVTPQTRYLCDHLGRFVGTKFTTIPINVQVMSDGVISTPAGYNVIGKTTSRDNTQSKWVTITNSTELWINSNNLKYEFVLICGELNSENEYLDSQLRDYVCVEIDKMYSPNYRWSVAPNTFVIKGQNGIAYEDTEIVFDKIELYENNEPINLKDVNLELWIGEKKLSENGVFKYTIEEGESLNTYGYLNYAEEVNDNTYQVVADFPVYFKTDDSWYFDCANKEVELALNEHSYPSSIHIDSGIDLTFYKYTGEEVFPTLKISDNSSSYFEVINNKIHCKQAPFDYVNWLEFNATIDDFSRDFKLPLKKTVHKFTIQYTSTAGIMPVYSFNTPEKRSSIANNYTMYLDGNPLYLERATCTPIGFVNMITSNGIDFDDYTWEIINDNIFITWTDDPTSLEEAIKTSYVGLKVEGVWNNYTDTYIIPLTTPQNNDYSDVNWAPHISFDVDEEGILNIDMWSPYLNSENLRDDLIALESNKLILYICVNNKWHKFTELFKSNTFTIEVVDGDTNINFVKIVSTYNGNIIGSDTWQLPSAVRDYKFTDVRGETVNYNVTGTFTNTASDTFDESDVVLLYQPVGYGIEVKDDLTGENFRIESEYKIKWVKLARNEDLVTNQCPIYLQTVYDTWNVVYDGKDGNDGAAGKDGVSLVYQTVDLYYKSKSVPSSLTTLPKPTIIINIDKDKQLSYKTNESGWSFNLTNGEYVYGNGTLKYSVNEPTWTSGYYIWKMSATGFATWNESTGGTAVISFKNSTWVSIISDQQYLINTFGKVDNFDGAVLAKALGVKDGKGAVVAGMLGTDANSLMLYAGATNFGNKETAKFRVYANGDVYADDLISTGQFLNSVKEIDISTLVDTTPNVTTVFSKHIIDTECTTEQINTFDLSCLGAITYLTGGPEDNDKTAYIDLPYSNGDGKVLLGITQLDNYSIDDLRAKVGHPYYIYNKSNITLQFATLWSSEGVPNCPQDSGYIYKPQALNGVTRGGAVKIEYIIKVSGGQETIVPKVEIFSYVVN